MTSKAMQLPLNIHLDDQATFENFYTPPVSPNGEALEAVQTMFDSGSESFIYLWGKEGCGRSHLLQAACRQAEEEGLHSQYLPLTELVDYPSARLLEGLETLDLVCLDNVDVVMGLPVWEESLFHLYNRLRESQSRILVAASCAPRELRSELPDLGSRLGWGVVYHLEELDDYGKQLALQHRAKARGLVLGDEVAQFIMSRAAREMDTLLDYLDSLDAESLAEQRKLTIPFVKAVLDW